MPRFLQILAGPRQVGKTAVIEPTISRDVMVLPCIDTASAYGNKVLAIEVKSGRNKGALAGLKLFSTSFSAVPGLLIGTGGIALEEFLAVEPESWMCV